MDYLKQITSKICIEDLIEQNASIDGKVTQQVCFIKKGIIIPDTYFFSTTSWKKTGFRGKITKELEEIVSKYPGNAEYLIRSETINESNRFADTQSESRLGISKDDLVENFLSVISSENNLINLVGLIQILPPNSVDMNLVSGVAKVAQRGQEKVLQIDLHRGLATYINRVGVVDFEVEIPYEDNKLNKAEYEIKTKDIPTLFQNQIFALRRIGSKLLTKKYSLIGLKQPFEIPFNTEKGRIKKEYEFSTEELNSEFKLDKDLTTFITKYEEDEAIQEYFKILSLSKIQTLNEILILAGLVSILKFDRKTKIYEYLNELLNTENPIKLLRKEWINLVIGELSKLSFETLNTHLCSFSVTYDTNSHSEKLILWDLPFDSRANVITNAFVPRNLSWIHNEKEIVGIKLQKEEDIGIEIPVTPDLNSSLIKVMEQIRKNKNIKRVFIRYSLLSHPATIIREFGLDVVSI